MTLRWKDEMAFEAIPPSGNHFTMDATPEAGGNNAGPTPVEALVASAAACSAMDVMAVLKKKRLEVTHYRIEVEWDRGPENVFPRLVTAVRICHVIGGPDLEPRVVEHAVNLSDEKYCTVIATLRDEISVQSSFELTAS